MTLEARAAQIQTALGSTPPRNQRLPIDLFTPFIEELWKAGTFPSAPVLQQWFPGCSLQALGMACFEWRSHQGLQLGRRKPTAKHPSVTDLVPLLDAAVATARHTCFDPDNDGRWPHLPEEIVHLLMRFNNRSLCNVLVLFAAVKIQTCTPDFILNKVRAFGRTIGRLMLEAGIEDVATINPNVLLFQVWRGEIGLGFNRPTKLKLFGTWTGIQNALDEYGESLSGSQLEKMRAFFLKPLTSRHQLSIIRPEAAYSEEQRERAKRKSDAVQAHFYRLRHVAAMRANQVGRLYQAVREAIAVVEAGKERLPFAFSYREPNPPGDDPTSTQIDLKLWDTVSLFDHSVSHGMRGEERASDRSEMKGSFAASRRAFLVEYLRPAATAAKSEPFWFLDVFRHRVFDDMEHKADAGAVAARAEFCRQWGYANTGKWGDNSTLLSYGRDAGRMIRFLERSEGREFIAYAGLYGGMLMGALVIRMGTITGARVGETQQIAQNPDCVKKLENVGPKMATRWVLRLFPKGTRTTRADYYIDDDTKDVLLRLLRFQIDQCGDVKIPVVGTDRSKIAPDRFVLQWRGHGVTQTSLNSMVRLLLHGLSFQAVDGEPVQISSHVLRHAFATELANQRVPIEVIARILHQRDTSVTKYYSQPTANQVITAAETLFVDRIDLAAEMRRSPDEIAKLIRDAEGKVGALTEVIGGTCTVGNMCPAKFACIGCSGNAPDPEKRQQVLQKRAWAETQAAYALEQGLLAEEHQMRGVMQSCQLTLDEMDLIDTARADSRRLVTITGVDGQ
jgi:integrase